MNKIFLRIWVKTSDSEKMLDFQNIELLFENFTESEVDDIYRKLEPLTKNSWKFTKLYLVSLLAHTKPAEETRYKRIALEQKNNLVKLSRHDDNLYVSQENFFEEAKTTINLILKLILETDK